MGPHYQSHAAEDFISPASPKFLSLPLLSYGLYREQETTISRMALFFTTFAATMHYANAIFSLATAPPRIFPAISSRFSSQHTSRANAAQHRRRWHRYYHTIFLRFWRLGYAWYIQGHDATLWRARNERHKTMCRAQVLIAGDFREYFARRHSYAASPLVLLVYIASRKEPWPSFGIIASRLF